MFKKILIAYVVSFIVCPVGFARVEREHISTAFLTSNSDVLEDGVQPLSPDLERWATKEFRDLNQSIFLYPKFVGNLADVQYRISDYKHDAKNRGQKFVTKTKDGVSITGTYFNRGSDKLLVVGEGFTNARETMTPFLSLFDDYDIALFDFRGQGHKPIKFFTPQFFATALVSSLFLHNLSIPKNLAISCSIAFMASIFGLNPFNWSARLSQATFGIDSSLITLGEKEELDVLAVIQEVKNRKQESKMTVLGCDDDAPEYKSIFGLGVCYGAFIFAKTQALYPGTFDKLILDGCWLDLPKVIAKLKKDLLMLDNPQKGGWSDTWPFNQAWCQNGAIFLTKNVWGLDFDRNNSIEDLLPKLNDTPVLFFHGKDDLMVLWDEFTTIWNKTGSKNKCVIVTSNDHVRNHLKQKELYKVLSELFLDLDYATFTKYIRNTKENMGAIKQYYVHKKHA